MVELRKTREEMAEKEVKLDAALSERVHLKKKCDEIAEALEKQALALEQMQVLSEGKLRALESKCVESSLQYYHWQLALYPTPRFYRLAKRSIFVSIPSCLTRA